MRAAKVQASLRIRQNLRCSLIQAVSQEEPSDRKARSMAPLNGRACAVKICNDGMLEDTNSLDGAQYKGREWTRNITVIIHRPALETVNFGQVTLAVKL